MIFQMIIFKWCPTSSRKKILIPSKKRRQCLSKKCHKWYLPSSEIMKCSVLRIKTENTFEWNSFSVETVSRDVITSRDVIKL